MSENNYTPSPIEALTSHSVEQRTLDALLRIEALLVDHFAPVPSDVTPVAKTSVFKKGRK